MNLHSPNPCCSRVNCTSFFFWLLLNLCFQQPNSGVLGVVFSGFTLTGVTWNSKICVLRFFFHQIWWYFFKNFFCPNLSPSRIPIKCQITWYYLSHGTEALFIFFQNFFTLYFSLNGYYWSTLKFTDISSIEPKLLWNHLVNFSFQILYFLVLEFQFGCFLNFHFFTQIPICLLIMFLWVCI